jgi:decaprenyl-phosphate phosphoribosyltransferase
MRPKQWVKNLLVFAVPLAAGSLADTRVLFPVLESFVVLTLASSAVYLVNDIRDASNDRKHPVKSLRPIASGLVSTRTAMFVALVLGTLSIVIPLLLDDFGLAAVVVTYLLLQAGYQVGLRSVAILDISIVASGFVLRTLAGGIASNLRVSNGFILVTGATALFVVAAKRFSELIANDNPDSTRPILRTYSPSYLRTVWTSSMVTAVIFYCLWAFELGATRNDLVIEISTVPFALILMRYAFHADQGKAEAPEAVLFSDRTLQVLSVCWALFFVV